MKKQPRSQPRDIDPCHAWYYVNDGSVDLILKDGKGAVLSRRLTRKVLTAMLAELKPLPRKKR